MTGDGEIRSPLPSLLKFSLEPMRQVFERTPFGGSRLPLETTGRKGGPAVASVTAATRSASRASRAPARFPYKSATAEFTNRTGYVSNFAKTRKPPLTGEALGIVMAYHTAAQLPVYDYLAANYAVCDRWFCSVPGATMPNRLYASAGRAAGSRDPAHPPIYHLPSFVRHLDDAKVSWGWFCHDDFPTLWGLDADYGLTHPGLPAYFDRQSLPLGPPSFLNRAAKGDLPSVSWIDPNFIDVSLGPAGSNDDHPPSDLRAGQDLIFKLFNAVVRGPAWAKTLLVIVYDEHGGFYDHVEPPQAQDDDPAFRRYGPRVPAIVVSPWVGQGQATHTIFDHTSIIKTILLRFCRKADGTIPHMGTRVATANHLGELLTAATPRPAPPVSDYQHLIDYLAECHKDRFHQAVADQAEGALADPPELTDWQQEYLEAKQAFAAEQTAMHPSDPSRQ